MISQKDLADISAKLTNATDEAMESYIKDYDFESQLSIKASVYMSLMVNANLDILRRTDFKFEEVVGRTVANYCHAMNGFDKKRPNIEYREIPKNDWQLRKANSN